MRTRTKFTAVYILIRFSRNAASVPFRSSITYSLVLIKCQIMSSLKADKIECINVFMLYI
jgi:hypothetical protein